MCDEKEIPWCKPYKIKGFWNTIFAYGCTKHPESMYKNKGYGRIVFCPHCNKQQEVEKYTRKGTIVRCYNCNRFFKYRPSF